MSDVIVAYCMKCKEKRELSQPEAVFTRGGTPATKGVCSVCGTALYRMGETTAHAGLEKPAPAPRKAASKRPTARKAGKATTRSAKSASTKSK